MKKTLKKIFIFIGVWFTVTGLFIAMLGIDSHNSLIVLGGFFMIVVGVYLGATQ